MNTMAHRDPQEAFAKAIGNGTLSTDESSPRYAGKYMHMHTDVDGDQFKHVDTRKYIVSL